ncbi:MAG: peptide ABC transporter permease [Gemmatimonadetes bacterium]|nr:MAG: peptide ABC transporter permease [Gemmatimonadota bacterium]
MTLGNWFALLVALVVAAEVVRALRHRAVRQERWRRFFRLRTTSWGLGILTFLLAVALAAPLLAPFDPNRQLDIVHLTNRPPSSTFLLGTDPLSRDVWSRLVYGTRVSLGIGALGALVAVALGDGLPFAALVVAIGLTSWFGTSRLVRAEVLSLRQRDFVVAARALGAGSSRVIVRHVLPNAAAPIIVSAALGVGNVLLLEAALSFLGIGVPPPDASWGNMIADGMPSIYTAPWSTFFPGLAISLVVMSLNGVADGVRDALDPREAP